MTSSSLLTYENTTYGIKMKYPADWAVINQNLDHHLTPTGRSVDVVVFHSPGADLFGAMVAVHRDDLNSSESVDIYAAQAINYDRINYANFTLLSSVKGVLLLGQPSYDLVYEYTSHDAVGRSHFVLQREVGTVIGQEGYTLFYLAETSKFNGQTLEPMIDSMQVHVWRLNETQQPVNPNVPEI
jgi:hypothetical protein